MRMNLPVDSSRDRLVGHREWSRAEEQFVVLLFIHPSLTSQFRANHIHSTSGAGGGRHPLWAWSKKWRTNVDREEKPAPLKCFWATTVKSVWTIPLSSSLVFSNLSATHSLATHNWNGDSSIEQTLHHPKVFKEMLNPLIEFCVELLQILIVALLFAWFVITTAYGFSPQKTIDIHPQTHIHSPWISCTRNSLIVPKRMWR